MPNSSCGAGAEPAAGIPKSHDPGSFEVNGELGWAAPSTTMPMPRKPAAPAPRTRRDPSRRLWASRVSGVRCPLALARTGLPRPASDGAVSDGAVSDGAVSDGAISDGAVSDDGVSDDGVSDDGVSDGPVADGDGSEGVERRERARARTLHLLVRFSMAGVVSEGASSATTGPSGEPGNGVAGAGVSRARCSGAATRSSPPSRVRPAGGPAPRLLRRGARAAGGSPCTSPDALSAPGAGPCAACS